MLAVQPVHEEHADVMAQHIGPLVETIKANPEKLSQVEALLGPNWISIFTSLWTIFGPGVIAWISKRFGITLPTVPPAAGQVMS